MTHRAEWSLRPRAARRAYGGWRRLGPRRFVRRRLGPRRFEPGPSSSRPSSSRPSFVSTEGRSPFCISNADLESASADPDRASPAAGLSAEVDSSFVEKSEASSPRARV